MIQDSIQAIVPAAGKSTRLKNGRNKLTEHICGQPMIVFATKMLQSLHIPTTLVVGQQKEIIQHCLETHNVHATYISQEEPLGTGHAVRCTQNIWHKDHILVLNGDVPLITADIIQQLFEKHLSSDAAVSFVMAHNTDPQTGYGRVVKDTSGKVAIIEAKEFIGDPSEHCCINAGIYIFKRTFLEAYIDRLNPNKISNEYHITDLVALASAHDLPIATIIAPFDLVRGVNDQHELWAAEQIQRAHIIKELMENGVRFSVAHNVHIDLNVKIGAGTYIGCGAHILYNSIIGENCTIHEYASLEHTILGDNSTILPFTVIKNAHIGSHTQIGPFAHLQEATIADRVIVGNFVEVKRSSLGSDSKAKHLAYIGDAQIGKGVNVGAGTVFCNYDGTEKQLTIVKDNVFIGSNNTIVAPLTIEENSFTAGGSTITKDVPRDSLAVARSLQINKIGYAQHLVKKNKKNILKPIPKAGEDAGTKIQFLAAKRTTNDPIENDGL